MNLTADNSRFLEIVYILGVGRHVFCAVHATAVVVEEAVLVQAERRGFRVFALRKQCTIVSIGGCLREGILGVVPVVQKHGAC